MESREVAAVCLFFFFFAFLLHPGRCVDEHGIARSRPGQVHLSFGESPWDMVVTWSTPDKTKTAVVKYENGNETKTAIATSVHFQSEHKHKSSSQYIHWATLKDLQPGANYTYVVGGEGVWSKPFVFRTPPANQTAWSPTLAVYGDMGSTNAKSLPHLEREVADGTYDAILHVGDFAYDMDTDGGKRGNVFLHQIEPIASAVPYMTCHGNHEQRLNYTEYKHRFHMPGGEQGAFFYSFNLGPLHIISISTEVYYFTAYGLKLIAKQYDFLEKDLQEATKPENRKLRPWIVVFGHRPMYCSNRQRRDCNEWSTRTRIGLPVLEMFALEPLFNRFGVDLMFWGHEHSYERHWPMYDYSVKNGSLEEPYTDPGAAVHITAGSAGCWERTAPFQQARPPWSAFRSTDYGYTFMKPYNHTHLYLHQFSVDKKKIIDSTWIVKNVHPKTYESS